MVLAAERSTDTRAKPRYAVIDGDIHPNLATPDALDPYLSERWREYRKSIGGRGFAGSYYPRAFPNAARTLRHPGSFGVNDRKHLDALIEVVAHGLNNFQEAHPHGGILLRALGDAFAEIAESGCRHLEKEVVFIHKVAVNCPFSDACGVRHFVEKLPPAFTGR